MNNETKLNTGVNRNENPEKKGVFLEDLLEVSSRIRSAYEDAKEAHKNQIRFSGEPYLRHVEEVTNIFLGWINPEKVDCDLEDLVCACLLHDTVEDTDVTRETIRDKFGENIRKLVDGVTLLRSDKPKDVQDNENLRLIAEKGYLTPEVFIIKLADRLHNMRTLDSVPNEAKRRAKADETLRVYTKLAESIGMWEVKKELEDLSFPYVYPHIYERVKQTIDSDPRRSKPFIHGMEGYLKWVLSETGADFQVESSKNSYWTLFEKMEGAAISGKTSPNNFTDINDAVSFRIITSDNDQQGLYPLLGRIHTSPQFKNKVNIDRFDDFINKPRDNGYSALQTTLDIPQFGAIEIAFVTEEMEDFNKFGIISSIKRGKNLDRYKRNIVFDSNNEAWFLPLNATYTDYAYLIGFGPQAKEVLVNGQKHSLTDTVENASSIEIVRHDEPRRSQDASLLDSTLLPITRKTIQQELNLSERDRQIKYGKEIFRNIISTRGLLDLEDYEPAARELVNTLRVPDLNNLYYLFGNSYQKPGAIKQILEQTKIEQTLDDLGITKEKLELTTILISGGNKKGILRDLTELITGGGGDILVLNQTRPITKPNETFMLRIVVRGLLQEENKIRDILEGDERFSEVLVV